MNLFYLILLVVRHHVLLRRRCISCGFYFLQNQNFFNECYKAYIDGRADKDPSEGWYEGELGFFDFYIIPLAKKLKECGCFGVSCDEYLNYATTNRKEWEAKGKAVVQGYLADYQRNHVGQG